MYKRSKCCQKFATKTWTISKCTLPLKVRVSVTVWFAPLSINNFERVVAFRAYTTRIVCLNDKYSVARRTLVQRSEYLFDVISEKCFEMKVWGRKNFTYDWLSTYLYVPGVLRLAGLAFRLAGARPTVVTKRNHTLGRLYWEFGSQSSFFSASHCRMPTQCPWYHSEHFSQPM